MRDAWHLHRLSSTHCNMLLLGQRPHFYHHLISAAGTGWPSKPGSEHEFLHEASVWQLNLSFGGFFPASLTFLLNLQLIWNLKCIFKRTILDKKLSPCPIFINKFLHCLSVFKMVILGVLIIGGGPHALTLASLLSNPCSHSNSGPGHDVVTSPSTIPPKPQPNSQTSKKKNSSTKKKKRRAASGTCLTFDLN